MFVTNHPADLGGRIMNYTCVIKEFRCCEMKIKEVKAGSCRESNPEHLWLEPPVLCHRAMAIRQPPTLTILYMYCTGGILNASVTHLAATQCVPSEHHYRSIVKFSPSGKSSDNFSA